MINFNSPRSMRLNEAFNYGFTMALLDDKFRALHPPVNCKDYFQDLFWTEHHEKPSEVYGFEWSPGTISLKRPTYYMGCRHSSIEIGKNRLNWQTFVNTWDYKRGYRLTKIRLDTPKSVLVEFDGAWTKKPVLMSAFTSILRMGSVYDEKSDSNNIWEWLLARQKPSYHTGHASPDFSRLRTILPRLKRLAEGMEPKQTYQEYESPHEAHERGIYGWEFPRK